MVLQRGNLDENVDEKVNPNPVGFFVKFHSMEGQTATTKYVVTRKRRRER